MPNDIELKRRDSQGNLVSWSVDDDGATPVSDAYLQMIYSLMASVRNLQYARDASDRMRVSVDNTASVSVSSFIDDRQKMFDTSRVNFENLMGKITFM